MERSTIHLDISALLCPNNNFQEQWEEVQTVYPCGLEPQSPGSSEDSPTPVTPLAKGFTFPPLPEVTGKYTACKKNGIVQNSQETYGYTAGKKPDDKWDASENRVVKQEKVVVVNGSSINDLPTEYEVRDLKHNELPVIGTYVDAKIAPGFKYRVRLLVRDRWLFGGRALCLQSVGRGYGKRITFQGDTLNENNNYFYSDSAERGCGFSLVALEEGDTFLVMDQDEHGLGQGTVRHVALQKEVDSFLEQPSGDLTKEVRVTFSCDVTYGTSKHGLMPMCQEETIVLSGTATVTRPKGSRKAVTVAVRHINLPCLGPCVLAFQQ